VLIKKPQALYGVPPGPRSRNSENRIMKKKKAVITSNHRNFIADVGLESYAVMVVVIQMTPSYLK
jgi:hypothetical protein